MRCDNCKFWKDLTGYGIGECNKMKEKVDADIVEGWEGAYLNTYETEDDFGCVLYESKEVVKNDKLQELESLAKGMESNVYTTCIINIFPQDIDNIRWAIERIKRYEQVLQQIHDVALSNSVDEFMTYGYVAKQVIEEK